jgi:hypothetical protein
MAWMARIAPSLLVTYKTVFFQMYTTGFGGRKNKSWTDRLSVKGDFEI